jgi:hypothetical protein
VTRYRVEFGPIPSPDHYCTGVDEHTERDCLVRDVKAILIDGEHYGDCCCPNEQHIARAVQEALADHEAWRSGTSIFAPHDTPVTPSASRVDATPDLGDVT